MNQLRKPHQIRTDTIDLNVVDLDATGERDVCFVCVSFSEQARKSCSLLVVWNRDGHHSQE